MTNMRTILTDVEVVQEARRRLDLLAASMPRDMADEVQAASAELEDVFAADDAGIGTALLRALLGEFS